MNLSKEEWMLVRDLLSLWDAGYDLGRCSRGCECQFCALMEKTGEHSAAVFEALKEKSEKGKCRFKSCRAQ